MEMFLIQWTARWAVCGYLARIWVEIDDRSKVSTRMLARRWWTFGCVGFVLHVICAFHFAHHWSHAAAWEATARRTAEMTGWYSGWGLAVNEGFLVLWICDTILWWRNLAWPENRIIFRSIQLVFAFLMIQATVVFGPPVWKWVAFVVLAMILIRRRVLVRQHRS